MSTTAPSKPIRSDQVARLVLETAFPLGDTRYTRAQKRQAVRAVLLHNTSLRAAADAIGAEHKTVQRWVEETRSRIRAAGLAAPAPPKAA